MSTNSTQTTPARKPKKPYPDFPLFPHASGCWAKKIRGKLHYFGSWKDDPDGSRALERFNREWSFLSQGKVPPDVDQSDGCTLRTLANSFLRLKEDHVTSGDLGSRSFLNYHKTCQMIISFFGADRRLDDLRTLDFQEFRSELSRQFCVTTLNSQINLVRIVLKFAHDERLIDQPINFGQSFNKPAMKSIRKHRRENGSMMFERDECLKIIDAADPFLKSMFLLSLNCGFGNIDCGSLAHDSVDFENGFVTHARPKTETFRRCPLWPESIESLKLAISLRPDPVDQSGEGLCYLTSRGNPFTRLSPNPSIKSEASESSVCVPCDSLAPQFSRLLKRLGINGRRRGFYSGRRTFATIASESKDQVAVDAIMGHSSNSMSELYRQRISDERLQAVTGTVRAWLWPRSEEGGAA